MFDSTPERRRGGRADDICRQIADDIALGRLAPGTRLDELTLAKRFGVSRTPVREALRQLGIMELVEIRPNRGAVVALMTPEGLDHIFEAIGELEAACARHAASRLSATELTTLSQLHARSREAMQAGDAERYDQLNIEFHAQILAGSHNPVLIETVRSFHNRVSSLRRNQFRDLERMTESYSEHDQILEALNAHDVVGAYRAMRSHFFAIRQASGQLAAWATPTSMNSKKKNPTP